MDLGFAFLAGGSQPARTDLLRKPEGNQAEHGRAPLPKNVVKAMNHGQGEDPDHGIEGYVSPESFARIVSKYSELEGQIGQLSEQNRRQMHEIETLRGGNSGFREGTSYLHARIAELEEQLSKTEVQMERCINQRDEWQQSYEAEIQAKAEEAKLRNRLKAENKSLKNEQSQWTRLFQMANFRNQSEAETHFRLREKCHKLEHAYERLLHQYEQREAAFQEHLKKVNGNMDELTAHCSSLAKQSGLRRAYVPVEDESEVLDAFRQLNVAVRYWCLAVWDLKPENAEVRFTSTPLARRNDVDFSTDEVWMLIACVWEWLMKAVFGVGNGTNQVFDLWMEEKTASHLASLERTVAALQKADVIHEWRSFTVQCLLDETWHEKIDRLDQVVAQIMCWLLPMLAPVDAESADMKKLIEELKDEVVKPAVSFAAMLRKRYTPIIVGTPVTVDSAVRAWVKNQDEEPELKIVIVPEMRKVDLDVDPALHQFKTICEAQWYALVEIDDEPVDETAKEEITGASSA